MMMSRATAIVASAILGGCTFAKDVLQAGVWVGVVAVVAVLLVSAAAMSLVKHA